jgi:hypothetical protein
MVVCLHPEEEELIIYLMILMPLSEVTNPLVSMPLKLVSNFLVANVIAIVVRNPVTRNALVGIARLEPLVEVKKEKTAVLPLDAVT